MRRNTTIIFLLMTLALSLLFGLEDAIAAIQEARARVYKDQDYNSSGGWRDVTESISNVGNYWTDSWNDQISSIEIFGGAKVILHNDTNFSGTSTTHTQKNNRVSNRNRISSITFFSPDAHVNEPSRDFGDLYLSGRDGAATYNANQTRTVNLSNNGVSGTKLYWEIDTSSEPSYITISPRSGQINSGQGDTLTFWINPTSAGNLSDSFKIITSDRANDGDKTISFSATVYDTPDVSHVAPDLGTNSKVNVAVNEDVTFEVGYTPLFPNATISRYQWQTQIAGQPVNDGHWIDGTTTDSFTFSSPNPFVNIGDYTIYVRAIDNSSIVSEPISIDVTAWNLPTVLDTPPTADIPTSTDDTDSNGAFSASELSSKASWLSSKYVTVLGDTVRLKADGSPGGSAGNEQIGMYRWDTDDGEFQQLAMTTFDGVDDAVVIKDYKGITGSNARTVAARITPDQAGLGTIVFWGDDSVGGGRWAFRVDDSGANWVIRVDINGGYVIGTTNINDGQPHHVAVVYSSSFGSGIADAKLYVDGNLESTPIVNDELINTVADADVLIGTDEYGRYFDGDITEVAIWSRALSNTEILEHENSGMTDALRTNLEKHLAETVEYTPSTATTGNLTATAVTNYGIESAGEDFTLKVYDLSDLDTGVTTNGSIADLTGDVSNLLDYGTNATATYQWQVNTESGLTFDGVDDYVLIPADTTGVNADFTDRTISLWFKTDNLNQTKAFIYEQGGGSHGLSIYLDAGVLYVGGWTSGWYQWLSTSGITPALKADQWYHVTWMLNSTSGEFEFWLDGEQVSTAAGPSNGISLHTNDNGIGAVSNGSRTQSSSVSSGNYFKGQIDDIAIFDSALSSTDIEELADTLPEQTSVFSTSPPIALWNLDDGVGTTATDSSTNGNDGTLQNGLTWLTTLTSVTTDTTGGATYSWTGSRDAVYLAQLSATAVSDELREITTATEVIRVTITAGSPIATTGGPYVGGIIGGDFSPIQFEGNLEGATEFDSMGDPVTIDQWQWTFDKTVTYNQGLIFDGIDDYVDIGSPTINTNSGLTLSAWMDPGANSSKLISEANDAVVLGLDTNGAPYFTITTDVATYTATAPDAVDAAYWHHVIGVYDGTQIELYVDGFLQAAEEANADGIVAATGTVTTTGQMKIGDGFTGRIDEVSIWEDALSEAEREALRLGALLNTGGIVGYWEFKEGNGTTAGDFTKNNDGILTNFPPDDNSCWVESTIEKTEDSKSMTDPLAIWNPTQTYDKAGEYSATLRIYAKETTRWSTTKETTLTIVAGSIAGKINAADLRTPVDGVTLTLTSAHVLNSNLSSLVATRPNLWADGEGGVATMTGTDGTYRFTELPLGTYRIVATKADSVDLNGDGILDTVIHEFETPVQVTTLTTSLPDQPAVDLVDLSVFPVGGKIRALPWDLANTALGEQPDEPNDNLAALLISDVVIEARPLGGNSSVESDPSDSTADATGRNYSLPMFAGRYQFFARLGGRDISLDEDVPHETLYTVAHGSTSAVRIVTINGATAGINFIDHTMYTLTITVEDSGENPIEKLADIPAGDDLDIPIEVDAILSGGAKTATKPVVVSTVDGTTSITYELPPGQYTLQAGNQVGNTSFAGQGIVFEDIDNPDELLSTLTVDLTAGDETATMVVPVQIQLEIAERPNLLNIFDTNNDGSIDASDNFYTLLTNGPSDDPPGFGLYDDPTPGAEDDLSRLEAGLEGYMFYYTPDLQTHTYAIRATANGHLVEDFSLLVTDEISQESDDAAEQQTFTISALFDTILSDHESDLNNGTITPSLESIFSTEGSGLSDDATVQTIEFSGDIPSSPDKWMITDGGALYFLQADGDQLHVDTGTYTVVGGLPKMDTSDPPNVLLKSISFQAKKDGYTASNTVNDSVTVLGDRLRGTDPQIVAIPNINYLVLHDPPGDGSKSFIDDSLTVKGIVNNMQIRPQGTVGNNGLNRDLRVFPAPWSIEREVRQRGWDEEEEEYGQFYLDYDETTGAKGLLGNKDFDNAEVRFREGAVAESLIGGATVAMGPLSMFIQIIAASIIPPNFSPLDNHGEPGVASFIQYEIRVNRHLETPSGDSSSELLGPGKGDVYLGEGWTLGFQDRYRFGLTFNGTIWTTETTEITTYDILDRTNQYIYTTRDIENIIDNLDGDIAGGSDVESDDLTSAQGSWKKLLEKNIAYQWSEFYIENADKLAELTAKQAAGTLTTLENWQLGHLQTAGTNIATAATAGGDTFEAFREAMGLPKDPDTADKDQEVETLIFSAGPEFQYSRTIAESHFTNFSRGVSVTSAASSAHSFKNALGVFSPANETKTEINFEGSFSISTSANWAASADSGVASEQTVGFTLKDDDVGDNYTTRVYEDPTWGTPLFIHDLGSITSDPWEPGTNKAVDITIETLPTRLGFLFGVTLADTTAKDAAVAAFDSNANTIPPALLADLIANGLATDDGSGGAVETIDVAIEVADSRWSVTVMPAAAGASEYLVRVETTSSGTWVLNVYEETTSTGPFDYHAGAHYRVKTTFTGFRELENKDAWITDFLLYPAGMSNKDNATVRFNNQPSTYKAYRFGLTANDPSSTMVVSIYPPEIDMDNSYEKEYSVVIVAEEEPDAQIGASLTLNPRFADLSPPKTQITSPHEGQRISPAMFGFDGDSGTAVDLVDAFAIQVVSDAPDISSIQIQSRTKLQNGVWSSWTQLGNTNGSVVTWSEGGASIGLGGEPMQRQYSFQWHGDDINGLGIGEYQFRALAFDKAGNPTGTPPPSDLPNAPAVTVIVDANEPTVLTTIPNYQDKESERIYRGELSISFTDDMREYDFSPVVSSSDNAGTFEVIDLLDDDPTTKYQSGFVSYSPSLRKAVFVPEVPFQANGFYKVTIRTDDASTSASGVHDLAGNPLDQEFSWTFRTGDSPFEEMWSIVLSATDDNSTDANNIASLEYGAEDGEDEKDARALPALTQMLELSFINSDGVEFDRDTRPPDGRLAHHWFFAVENPTGRVWLRWKPSSKLVQSRVLRQYKDVRLIEFIDDGNGNLTQNTITPDPEPSDATDNDNLPTEIALYNYMPNTGETVRYFRLDVMKASFVATAFSAGTSGWSFFSVPIKPGVAEPFVNLGDDIEPFQLFSYDTPTSGYKVYPFDLGEVSLQTGHGYFTRLERDVEVDVGGTKNLIDVNITLEVAGWHPIGNPFILPVKVADLLIDQTNQTTSFSDAVLANDVEAVLYRWIIGGNSSFKTTESGTTLASLNSDPATVSPELSVAFSDNGLPLVSPQVSVVVAGESWEIEDEDTNYEIIYISIDGIFKVTQKSDFYRAVDVSTDVNAELDPWGGYWLKTLESGLTLTIPAPNGVSSAQLPLTEGLTPPLAPAVVPKIAKTSGVFDLRLAVTADFASDLTTTLGTRPDASAGYDRFDRSEPPTLGQTVSAYFNHPEWGESTTQFNADYQAPLEVGETRTWEFVVFTDRPKAEMTLSWASALRNVPDDVMLSLRRKGEEEWSDMRLVQTVEITSETRITRIPFEVRAERFEMAPPDEMKVVFDEGQVEIRWRADDNPFITGYTITRTTATAKDQKRTFSLRANTDRFVDTDVIEELTYTYQLTVGFKSGARLHSELIKVTVRPIIKETVLLQNYPNPFNPETWIPYELAEDANVSVGIYNVSGHLIRSLDLGLQPRGRYTSHDKAAYWDGRNDVGERIASGVYFYVISTGHYAATRKMVIVK